MNYSWKISWWKGLGLRFIVFFNMKTIKKLWNVKTICPRMHERRIKGKLWLEFAWIVLLRGFIFLHFHATHHKRNVEKNLVYLAILPCQCGNKKSNHEKKILRPFRRIVMFTRLSSLILNKLRHYIANTSAMESPKSGLCWTLQQSQCSINCSTIRNCWIIASGVIKLQVSSRQVLQFFFNL